MDSVRPTQKQLANHHHISFIIQSYILHDLHTTNSFLSTVYLIFYKKLLLIPLSNEDKRINQVYSKHLSSIACAPSPHQHHAFPPNSKTSVVCTLSCCKPIKAFNILKVEAGI
jgi:hypothetical protein